MSEMAEKPIARLIRENEALLKVAYSAARLRRLGKACEGQEEAMRELWESRPEITRSTTSAMMLEQAFETAMKEFDESIVECAEVFAHEPFVCASISIGLSVVSKPHASHVPPLPMEIEL